MKKEKNDDDYEGIINGELEFTLDDKEKDISNINYGIICQKSPFINCSSLMNSFFKYTNINNLTKNDINKFEFISEFNHNCDITLSEILNIHLFNELTEKYDFFIVLIDLENQKTIDELSKIVKKIDCVINTNDLMNKIYILGFYQKENQDNLTEEHITAVMDTKRIMYDYNDMNIKEIAKISTAIKSIVNDSYTMMKYNSNKNKEDKISNSQSGSNCVLF